MSPSMFDDLDATPSGAMEAIDSRTLRLSAHPLTEEELQGLIRYQEAFLARVEGPSGGPEAVADAHQAGLEASGLDVKRVELGTVLLRAYCGQRWTARRLRTRLVELEAQADAASAEKAAKARTELRRIEDLEPLARRHGQESLELLAPHEEHLVALHARMQRALTRA
ncbi:hypothetical protein [Cystobacter ferrugineus]|uniref:Uncharacterized protein n=1 Tax=Cystobacter ferrugineus TaxID=83449 RepID=A0A1L9BHT4_9BACT|nr:hypothetical protein [Cystobacter ferrugineus]OJH41827.1 hypothetical protein BON30_00885 [Cystobacter ferrugineus]